MATTNLIPNAPGDRQELYPNTGAEYQCIDDPIGNHDSGTTYLQAQDPDDSTSMRYDLFNLPDLPSNVVNIQSVKVIGYVTGGSNVRYRLGIKSGSEAWTSEANCPGSYSQVSNVWSSPPGGGSWSVPALNALQIGVALNSAKDSKNDVYARCTQLYVEVTCTTNTPVDPLDAGLDLAADAPAVSTLTSLGAADTALDLATGSPAIEQSIAVDPQNSSLDLGVTQPDLAITLAVDPVDAGLDLEAVAAGLMRSRNLAPDDAGLELDSDSPALGIGLTIQSVAAELALGANDPGLIRSRIISPDEISLDLGADSPDIGGQVSIAPLDAGLDLAADVGHLSLIYALAPQPANLELTASAGNPQLIFGLQPLDSGLDVGSDLAAILRVGISLGVEDAGFELGAAAVGFSFLGALFSPSISSASPGRTIGSEQGQNSILSPDKGTIRSEQPDRAIQTDPAGKTIK